MTLIAAAQIRLAIRNANVAMIQMENFISIAYLLTGLPEPLVLSSTQMIWDLRLEMTRLTDLLAASPVSPTPDPA